MRVTTFHGAGASPPTVAAGGGAAGAGFGFGVGFGVGVGFGAAATTGAGFGIGFRGAAAACDLGSPRALVSLSLQNSALRTSFSSRSATFASSFLMRPSAVSRLRCASNCASLAPAAAAPLRRITRPRIGTSNGVKMSPSRRSRSRTSASGRASLASASVLQTPPSRAVTLQRTGSGRHEGERSCGEPMNEAAAPAAAAALSMAARAAAAPPGVRLAPRQFRHESKLTVWHWKRRTAFDGRHPANPNLLPEAAAYSVYNSMPTN